MSKPNEATWYSNVFAKPIWSGKLAGSKPSVAQLQLAHQFGKPGKQSLALAMAMRDGGVTASQIQLACGAPQNNHRRGLITEGMFKRVPAPPSVEGHTVYKIELTPKGQASIDRTAKAEAAKGEAKPAKAKASKPRAAKPTNPAPVTEAPAPVEAAPTEAPQA